MTKFRTIEISDADCLEFASNYEGDVLEVLISTINRSEDYIKGEMFDYSDTVYLLERERDQTDDHIEYFFTLHSIGKVRYDAMYSGAEILHFVSDNTDPK